MPFQHRLQTSRFELKYIVSPQRAAAIRDFLRAYMEPDEHACPQNEHGAYPVHSLYLDSPALALCQQTEQGLKNRFKLRIRFYDDDRESPAYLEIKRRVTDVIRKERAPVWRPGVDRLLAGERLYEGDLAAQDGSGNSNGFLGPALQRFCELAHSIGARGTAYVSYLREAYVLPHGDQARVTFDRGLRGAAYVHSGALAVPPDGRRRPELSGVILELKFTDRFPDWMRELVESFDLQRRSVPKYVLCAKALALRPGRYVAAETGLLP